MTGWVLFLLRWSRYSTVVLSPKALVTLKTWHVLPPTTYCFSKISHLFHLVCFRKLTTMSDVGGADPVSERFVLEAVGVRVLDCSARPAEMVVSQAECASQWRCTHRGPRRTSGLLVVRQSDRDLPWQEWLCQKCSHEDQVLKAGAPSVKVSDGPWVWWVVRSRC